MGIEEVITAPRSPWQNPFAERVIGLIRRPDERRWNNPEAQRYEH